MKQLLLTAKVPNACDPAAVPLEQTDEVVPHDVARAVDTILSSGRRVLLRYGLQGATSWKTVPDGLDTASASQTYWQSDAARTVGRCERVPLTPGYLVRLDVVALPSGPTQSNNGMTWELDAVQGEVLATVTYRSAVGDETVVSAAIALPPSDRPFAGEPDGATTAALTKLVVAVPDMLDPELADWAAWTSLGVEVDVELEIIGSARPIDIALIEHPFRVVVADEDDWPSAMYTTGAGVAPEQPLSTWPLTQLDDDDKSGGVVAIAEGVAAHGDVLGPVLWWWGCASEAAAMSTWSGGQAAAFLADGTTKRLVPAGTASSTQSALAGSHGATLVQCGELGAKTAVLPVWIEALMRCTGTGTAYLEIGTSDFDTYKLSTTSLVLVRVRVAGWLETGVNPQDAPAILARAYASVGGIGCEVSDIWITRRSLR